MILLGLDIQQPEKGVMEHWREIIAAILYQSHGQPQNFSSSSPGDLNTEGHVAFAVFSHSVSWDEGSGQTQL